MRWLLVLVAVSGLLGSWWISSPLWFGLGLLIGVISALAAALAFAQARIESSAQPELMSDHAIEALKLAVRQSKNNHSESVSSGEH